MTSTLTAEPTTPPVDFPASAARIAALAAGAAEQADAEGRLAPEVVKAVRKGGFARHFVPSVWGGAEGSFADLAEATVQVAAGCAATAWCASLAAYGARFAGYLPEQGQADIWSNGPDVLLATGLVPSGTAVRTDGGWLVSGEFGYVSGIDHAEWALLCGPAPTEGDTEARFFAVPRDALRVRPTWDAVGMRATGSHTVVVDGTVVPDHRSFARAELMRGTSRTSNARCHQVPFGAAAGLSFLPTALGAGIAAVEWVQSTVAARRRNPALDVALARAAAQLDAARLLVERSAGVLDEGKLTPVLAARSPRDAAVAAELVESSVNGLVRACGTSGLAGPSPLQRAWRDVTVAVSHVALRLETSGPMWVTSVQDARPAAA